VLLLEALEADALLGVRRLAELLEHLLDILEMPLCLLEVLLERTPELLVRDLGDELRQHLGREGALDVHDVAELVQEQVAGCRDLGHAISPFVVGQSTYPLRRRGNLGRCVRPPR
jgi:hypothetical protein